MGVLLENVLAWRIPVLLGEKIKRFPVLEIERERET